VSLEQSVFNADLHNQYRARKDAERASVLSIQDSRDVVVLAVGLAYSQAAATAARVETAKAQLASARELDDQTAHRLKNEVAPEIDSIRAQVERQSAEQRVVNVTNQLAKDKLTLARVIGLSIEQQFELTDPLRYRTAQGWTSEEATQEALRLRADLRSAQASVDAASFNVRAEKGQRIPSISIAANYGGAGTNLGSFDQVYALSAAVSVPIYRGGRIQADIRQAEADLQRRQAEYADLKGRVAYDVRLAWLDLTASDSSVQVALRNQELARRALVQSQDRYTNGVTNYLEVIQTEEAVAVANENYIQSVFSYQVAEIALARAVGNTQATLAKLLGGK